MRYEKPIINIAPFDRLPMAVILTASDDPNALYAADSNAEIMFNNTNTKAVTTIKAQGILDLNN